MNQNQGIGIGLMFLPFMIGGTWVAWWWGINDVVHGTALVLMLLFGPYCVCEWLLSDEGKRVGNTERHLVIYLICVAVLAYVFYCTLGGYPIDRSPGPDGWLGRYLGCAIWAWATMPFINLALDRVFNIYERLGAPLMPRHAPPKPANAVMPYRPLSEEEVQEELYREAEHEARKRAQQDYKFDPARFKSRDGG